MTAVETLTALMDKARQKTGLTEKISVPRLTGLMDHFDLHINPNLLDGAADFSGNWVNSGKTWKLSTEKDPFNGNAVMIQNENILWYGIYNQTVLQKGTYTFSLDYKITSLGGKAAPSLFFYVLANSDEAAKVVRGNNVRTTPGVNQWNHASYTFTVADTTTTRCRVEMATSGFQLCVSSCKLEVGDLATPLEKVGGGS